MKEPSNAFKYCWAVLGYNKYILMSWGIDPYSIKEIPSGTSFHVEGFIHTGYVEVTIDYGSDTFQVILKNDNGEIIDSQADIYLGEVVRVIDEKVEKTHDYKERICKTYLVS